MELQPITHLWLNRDNDLLDLALTTTSTDDKGKQEQSSEVIHTNQKHPFLTEEQGFVPAGEIVAGMHLVRADGSVGLVSRWQVVPGVQMMYNLTVAQNHTFTVGDGQWVVHNCNINYDNLKLTRKVLEHYETFRKRDNVKNGITKFFKGESERPFVQDHRITKWLITNIIDHEAKPDPRGFTNSWRWDVVGTWNGKEGVWELVINVEREEIWHFNFNSRG